tara:strand:- start:188 stop:499 length:312 start_codon:yes stop_codon:yes gene_type:complete
MPKKNKLSRFERKFKRARKKGKETFKFRKPGESIFKKRGVYTTKLKEDETMQTAPKEDSGVSIINNTAVEFEKWKQRMNQDTPAGSSYKKGGVVRDMFTQQYD